MAIIVQNLPMSLIRPAPHSLLTCLVAVGLAAGCGSRDTPTPPAHPFELEEATIADLQRRMTTGQETARSLAQKYVARINAIDRRGPVLHSVIDINPDALTIADALDAERKAK